MKEEFIKLDGQDKSQKIFYDPQQKANNKTLADMPKIQQCSHEWLGDASVFVSSLLFQGGTSLLRMRKDSLNIFKNYGSNQWLHVSNQISSINSKTYLKAK